MQAYESAAALSQRSHDYYTVYFEAREVPVDIAFETRHTNWVIRCLAFGGSGKQAMSFPEYLNT
jgi:hypothetical protein